MDDEDREIVERELKDAKSRAYWKSPEFTARWHDLMYRRDHEPLTIEEAAQLLRVPVPVFQVLYAHRLSLDALGMSEGDFLALWAKGNSQRQ